ncbi:uncharacterized protein B0I36DRAFT_343649 [Microdochium trichocladiopsis]|uniref:Uncharacterized protein n=1 Tax=Microdochium trichocladiopsis TaxID=1682393 RepID=A0A9P8YIB8_9PEZI|nr:uncharacterized protein B0I36DRAFT_343649 [Microdochium trichocladiopsis]KAH7039811.1 hypothetical protein B0I36DRAFT_343649 [Microdochium trichocladiopsis]
MRSQFQAVGLLLAPALVAATTGPRVRPNGFLPSSGKINVLATCGVGEETCEWGCMDAGAVCCNDNTAEYCNPGYFCIPDGCCPEGNTCDGYSPAPSTDDDGQLPVGAIVGGVVGGVAILALIGFGIWFIIRRNKSGRQNGGQGPSSQMAQGPAPTYIPGGYGMRNSQYVDYGPAGAAAGGVPKSPAEPPASSANDTHRATRDSKGPTRLATTENSLRSEHNPLELA